MSNPAEGTAQTDLAEMERWVAWVVRLTAHTAERAEDEDTRDWLEGAKEDAESLQEALVAAADGWLDAGQIAIVRSVYELWDANHDRTERIASVVDPRWHREWVLRSDGARPGAPSRKELALSSVA